METARHTSRRYDSLDAWRGFACLAVLVFHASGAPRMWGPGALFTVLASGWMGVPIFFVISGYCITAAVHRAAERGFQFSTYVARRLMRIFPPYWAMLSVVAATILAASALGHGDIFTHAHDQFPVIRLPLDIPVWQWLGSVTLTEGWRAHFVWRGGPGWFLPIAWSLGYEEQFYVIAGLLMLFASRFWFQATAALTLVVIATVALVPVDGIRGFWFDGRWLLFAYGIGVFWHAGVSGVKRTFIPVAAAAGTIWAVCQPGFGGQTLATEIAVAGLVSAALIALHPYDRQVAAQPLLRPLAWCGQRCYSIYLLHWPLAKAAFWCMWTAGFRHWASVIPVTIALTLIATALVAHVFYIVVERPSMLWTPRSLRMPLPSAAPEYQGAANV